MIEFVRVARNVEKGHNCMKNYSQVDTMINQPDLLFNRAARNKGAMASSSAVTRSPRWPRQPCFQTQCRLGVDPKVKDHRILRQPRLSKAHHHLEQTRSRVAPRQWIRASSYSEFWGMILKTSMEGDHGVPLYYIWIKDQVVMGTGWSLMVKVVFLPFWI